MKLNKFSYEWITLLAIILFIAARYSALPVSLRVIFDNVAFLYFSFVIFLVISDRFKFLRFGNIVFFLFSILSGIGIGFLTLALGSFVISGDKPQWLVSFLEHIFLLPGAIVFFLDISIIFPLFLYFILLGLLFGFILKSAPSLLQGRK